MNLIWKIDSIIPPRKRYLGYREIDGMAVAVIHEGRKKGPPFEAGLLHSQSQENFLTLDHAKAWIEKEIDVVSTSQGE